MTLENKKAGALGVEPRSTDSKSGVLPLHHAPVGTGDNFNTKCLADMNKFDFIKNRIDTIISDSIVNISVFEMAKFIVHSLICVCI